MEHKMRKTENLILRPYKLDYKFLQLLKFDSETLRDFMEPSIELRKTTATGFQSP